MILYSVHLSVRHDHNMIMACSVTVEHKQNKNLPIFQQEPVISSVSVQLDRIFLRLGGHFIIAKFQLTTPNSKQVYTQLYLQIPKSRYVKSVLIILKTHFMNEYNATVASSQVCISIMSNASNYSNFQNVQGLQI